MLYLTLLNVLEEGLVRTMEDALKILQHASQPLGLRGGLARAAGADARRGARPLAAESAGAIVPGTCPPCSRVPLDAQDNVSTRLCPPFRLVDRGGVARGVLKRSPRQSR